MSSRYTWCVAIAVILVVIGTCIYDGRMTSGSSNSSSSIPGTSMESTCSHLMDSAETLYQSACNDRHLMLGLLHVNSAMTMLACIEKHSPGYVPVYLQEKIDILHKQILQRLCELAPMLKFSDDFKYNLTF